MFKNKQKNKKNLLVLALMGGMTCAQAEVLVILPESGPMARAASSIKQGFQSAYELSGTKEPLKFVNTDQKKISDVLKKHVSKKTALIVGPLPRSDVEALIKAKPKVKVLALNDGAAQANNIAQFSLGKKDDAQALHRLLQKDQIKDLYVLRQPGTEAEHDLFLISLAALETVHVYTVEQQPEKLKKRQALLLLGNNAWLNEQQKLPNKRIYTLANAIEDGQPIPQGMKFCDIPALYGDKQWLDLHRAYQAKPVSMQYQRLLAFGADAWTISQIYLQYPELKNTAFEGRTGQIQMDGNQILRQPVCYQNTRKGIQRV